jgi:hypothetical protein
VFEAADDLILKAGTRMVTRGAAAVDFALTAGGNIHAPKLKVEAVGGSKNATLSIEADGEVFLKGARLSVSSYPGFGTASVDITAGEELTGRGMFTNAFATGTDFVRLRSESGDLLLRGASLYGDAIDTETCHGQGAGCGSFTPVLDVRGLKQRSTGSFCIDGQDVSDVEDVIVKETKRSPVNGC